jgi:outer membrane protein insertion porin family
MTRGIQNVCVCALLTAGAALGQAAFPLETLKITGNQRFPLEKIVAASGLKVGVKVSKADFENARARLMATGAFENVGYAFKPSADNGGFDAVMEVVEVQQVYPFRFEDLPVAENQLRAALRELNPFFGDEIPVTNQVLDKYLAAIQGQVGPTVKVAASLNSDLPGPPMILFRPNTPRDLVAEVKFKGNQVLPSDPLIRAIAGVAVGTAFSENTIRVLLDSSVRPLYEARGRVRVAFPKIEPHPSLLSDGVAVLVTVEEGPSYSLGEVHLNGVNPADAAELQKAANLQPKDLANFDEIKAGTDRVLGKLQSTGHLHAAGKVERQIDDQNHLVNVTLALDPGPQFTMGKLEILGLDASSEPEIHKMWELKTGAPFQPEYPDAFLNDIRARQLFNNLGRTRSETNLDEKAHTVDVKLYFASVPRKKTEH